MRIIAALLALGTTSSAFAEDKIEVVVQVKSDNVPGEVTVQRENDLENVLLIQSVQDGAFYGKVARPVAQELIAEKKLVAPYRLVASWEDVSEQMYLGLRATVPAKLPLRIYHRVYLGDEANANSLRAIESLGTDYESILKKYFWARAFHRHWRFKNQQPEYWSALRSARIWFDAALNLVNMSNSFYRMDDEVKSVMEEYEVQAKSDADFRRRYRNYASAGYVDGMLLQVAAANYAFVGKIPRLVARGELEEAATLNAKALSALSNESTEARGVVLKLQGVSVEQLTANKDFIAAKQAVQLFKE